MDIKSKISFRSNATNCSTIRCCFGKWTRTSRSECTDAQLHFFFIFYDYFHTEYMKLKRTSTFNSLTISALILKPKLKIGRSLSLRHSRILMQRFCEFAYTASKASSSFTFCHEISVRYVLNDASIP